LVQTRNGQELVVVEMIGFERMTCSLIVIFDLKKEVPKRAPDCFVEVAA
jgi:hypothetical protein